MKFSILGIASVVLSLIPGAALAVEGFDFEAAQQRVEAQGINPLVLQSTQSQQDQVSVEPEAPIETPVEVAPEPQAFQAEQWDVVSTSSVTPEVASSEVAAEEIYVAETSVSAADLQVVEEPQVAQAPEVAPVQAEPITTTHFGVNGEFGGQVSAEVYTEDGLSVVTGRATVTTESGVTADAWHQQVTANDEGTYQSSETGAAVSFPLNDYAPDEETGETPRLAVRGHVYGLTHQDEFVNSDASWSGQGSSTTVGAQVQARYLLNEEGTHVLEGHLGLEYSTGTTIGSTESFSQLSPTAYLGYNGQLSDCTSVYVGAGYSQDVYADANIRHNLVCQENLQIGVGAYAGYRNDRLQAGPELSVQVGNSNREGLNLDGFVRFDVVTQTPAVGVRAQLTF